MEMLHPHGHPMPRVVILCWGYMYIKYQHLTWSSFYDLTLAGYLIWHQCIQQLECVISRKNVQILYWWCSLLILCILWHSKDSPIECPIATFLLACTSFIELYLSMFFTQIQMYTYTWDTAPLIVEYVQHQSTDPSSFSQSIFICNI